MGQNERLEWRGRVHLKSPQAQDRAEFLELTKQSVRYHRPWVRPATDAMGYAGLLRAARQDGTDTLFLVRNEDEKIVGYFNFSQIFRGPFCNAYLGYWIGKPYASNGYMTEGMGLVLRRAFSQLRLHRVEVNVQPENTDSIALVERTGFRREGFSPRYLKVGGRWRDHERWAMTVEDWRAGRTRKR